MEKEELIQLYYNEGLSLRDIGKKFGKSMKFTQHWLKIYNLKPRNLSESSKMRCVKKPQTNPGRKGMPKRGLKGKDNPSYKKGFFIRKDGYKMLNFDGKQIMEHRHIWIKHNCNIPKGYHIHHIDGDKLNNKIENLQLMKNSDHQKLHNQPRDKLGRFEK